MKEFLQSIVDSVRSIFSYNIETTNTYNVPARDDAGLTFSRDQIKRGKLIKTCVLFIDIRNSTKMSRDLAHDKIKLGKIYSAFIHAMTTIADRHGYVRNIIGDRIMVVFEPNNCFEEAMSCASTMITIAQKVLAKYSGLTEFLVGIGVDFGEALILKTGLAKKHEDRSEYKSLVWIGDVANIASKLTDLANKKYTSHSYNITYKQLRLTFAPPVLGQGLRRIPVNRDVTETLSQSDFDEHIQINNIDDIKYNIHKVIAIKKSARKISDSPILISGHVYEGIKGTSIYKKFFSLTDYPDNGLSGIKIYGGNFYKTAIDDVKI